MNRPKTFSPISASRRFAVAASTVILTFGLSGLPAVAAPQDQAPPPAQDQAAPPPPQDQGAPPPENQGAPPEQAPPQQQAPPPPGPYNQGPYGQGPYQQGPYGPGPYGQAPYGGYPQGAPPPNYPYPGQQGPYPGPQGQQQAPPVPAAPLPASLTLPAGTIIPMRVNDFLSSNESKVGQIFTGSLDQPLVVLGWVVAQRGAPVSGQVSVAQKSERGKNDSQLGVVLTEVTLVTGQQAPVTTELMQVAARSSPYDTNRKVGTVLGTAILGTAIGGIAGGGTGAAIGAGLGATTGGAIILSTRGRPTVIPREALVTFRLQQPLTITTTGSESAFQQIRPGSFGGDQDAYGSPGYGRGPVPPGYGAPGYGGAYPPTQAYPAYPAPPAYYYGAYPYAWGYPYYPFYAYPFVGFGFGVYSRGFYGRPYGFRRF